ncbi:MAG: glutathionylspermidine synthase family protein [Spirochaetes bacterium]|nr:MAG: glutathionylspermidine synthase family protein [Spirochaetota bacterium]
MVRFLPLRGHRRRRRAFPVWLAHGTVLFAGNGLLLDARQPVFPAVAVLLWERIERVRIEGQLSPFDDERPYVDLARRLRVQLGQPFGCELVIRKRIVPRPDWTTKVEEHGLNYHTLYGQIYWDESAYYEFTLPQIDKIEDVTNELHRMCLKAVERVVSRNLFDRLRIPPVAIPLVKSSWERNEPHFYGRFDLWYDGQGEPRLLEYNADTPTALLEASVIQWHWLQDVIGNSGDQFNSIHEKMLDYWRERKGSVEFLHVSCMKDSDEDLGNTAYVQDVAEQAGIPTGFVYIDDIGFDGAAGNFVDEDDTPIRHLFKLYPWEWMFQEEFFERLYDTKIALFEPPWKSLLSNKAILAVLWEMYPDHPNLLPTYINDGAPPRLESYVIKPFLAREGANIRIVKDGAVIHETQGTYSVENSIVQAFAPLPEYDGNFPVIGSWVIGDRAAGIGIRESATLVTDNLSRFVPHVLK